MSSDRAGAPFKGCAVRRTHPFDAIYPEGTLMKIKHLLLSSFVAFAGLAALAPTIASAAPRGHQVCHWDHHHHHRVCHWVR